MIKNLKKVFVKFDDDFLEFKKVANKLSNCPAIHAFILLDKLVPQDGDMVSAAEHDEIFLAVTLDELAAVATEEQVLELVRCGVSYKISTDSLVMFV